MHLTFIVTREQVIATTHFSAQ